MNKFLILTLLISTYSFGFEVKNISNIDSTSVNTFVSLLKKNKSSFFKLDENELITIYDCWNKNIVIELRTDALPDIEVIDSVFCFELTNKKSLNLVKGIVLNGKVYLNSRDFSLYIYEDFYNSDKVESFNKIKSTNKKFKKYSINPDGVITSNGKDIGEIKYSYLVKNESFSEWSNFYKNDFYYFSSQTEIIPIYELYFKCNKKFDKSLNDNSDVDYFSVEYYYITYDFKIIEHGVKSGQIHKIIGNEAN